MTNNLTINGINDEPEKWHCFFAELCIRNQLRTTKKTEFMRKEKETKEPLTQAQKRLGVTVRTVRNGYLLEVGGDAYMYYDAEGLLEGFLLHVGLKRKGAMTKEERQRLTEALKEDGAARELQRELTELKATIVEQKKVIRELKCEIKRLED